jgi:aspartate kinase
MSTLVMKFGGNMLGTESGIHDALDVIAAQHKIWSRNVVVTSALAGVTDALHQIVQVAETGDQNGLRADVAALREIHVAAAHLALNDPHQQKTLHKELDSLFFDLLDDCDIIRQRHQADPAMRDRVVAMGEMFITRIVAAAGRARGLDCVAMDATHLIVTDERHSNARPIAQATQQRLEQNLGPLLDRQIIPIITGYIGATESGAVTTLGRGGSDYSATYLGGLLNAEEVWFFTDVDGLMSADPDVVEEAHMLPTSSYSEVAEMAHFGARVIHPRAIEPLIQHQIPLRIRSLADPANTGTYICDVNEVLTNRIHAITQALGIVITGPSRSNMVEVCNRLISISLNDDIQPSMQVEVYAGSLIMYVAPTSANQDAFLSAIEQLHQADADKEWQISTVTAIAVIGNLTPADYLNVLRALDKKHIAPTVFGVGHGGVFLMAFDPSSAEMALNTIHKLI